MRDTPPYRAIPRRHSIAEGGITPNCLAFMWYRASIAEIPLWGGEYRTSALHALPGGNAQKRGRGYCTQLVMLRRQNPIARNRWASLRYRGQKNRTRKKTNSWERRFPGTFRTNVPLILPIFSVFSVGGGQKVPRNFVPGNFFFLILDGFSPSEDSLAVSRNTGPLRALNSCIWGTGNGKPATNIGSTLPWTLSQPSVWGAFENQQLQPSQVFCALPLCTDVSRIFVPCQKNPWI